MGRKIISWLFSFMPLVMVYVKTAPFVSLRFNTVFGNGGELISGRPLGTSFLTSNFQVILKVN